MNLVSVNPNPVMEQINISVFSMDKQQCLITIFDEVGRNCFDKIIMLEKGNQRFKLSNSLKAGIYLARINFGKEDVTTRFVKL